MPKLTPHSHLIAKDNTLMREIILSNQEGQLYYATCYEHFIDLSDLNKEFHSKGIMRHFIDSITNEDDENQSMIEEIANKVIPEKRYYISFTNCLISLKSHKYQFLRILDALYVGTTQGRLKCSFEQAINNIVFGLPHPV